MTTVVKRRKTSVVVRVDDTLRFTSRVYAPVCVVSPELRRLGIVWQYDSLLRCYLIPKRRTDDLLCALELAGHRVDVQMPGWS